MGFVSILHGHNVVLTKLWAQKANIVQNLSLVCDAPRECRFLMDDKIIKVCNYIVTA